jgi:hypothetical protein
MPCRLVVKKGSNSLGMSSLAMPAPWSLTVSRSPSPSRVNSIWSVRLDSGRPFAQCTRALDGAAAPVALSHHQVESGALLVVFNWQPGRTEHGPLRIAV